MNHESVTQVFEYLDTDLKKFMDRNGKGISNPMAPQLIKVRSPHPLLRAAVT